MYGCGQEHGSLQAKRKRGREGKRDVGGERHENEQRSLSRFLRASQRGLSSVCWKVGGWPPRKGTFAGFQTSVLGGF